MASNNNMGLTDLEEISTGVAGVASLLSAIQIGQENSDSFDEGLYFLQIITRDLADRLHEYTTQAFKASRAKARDNT